MAFDYEAAKAQFGAQRAREMQQQDAMSFPPAPTGAPAAPAPAPIGGAAPKPAPAPAPSGGAALMDFNTWQQQWKSNAAAAGQTALDQNAQTEYDKYKFLAQNPNGGNLGQAGTGTEEQRRTGAMAAGSFADDNPDAGRANTG